MFSMSLYSRTCKYRLYRFPLDAIQYITINAYDWMYFGISGKKAFQIKDFCEEEKSNIAKQ